MHGVNSRGTPLRWSTTVLGLVQAQATLLEGILELT
jgi:hypothetical protein